MRVLTVLGVTLVSIQMSPLTGVGDVGALREFIDTVAVMVPDVCSNVSVLSAAEDTAGGDLLQALRASFDEVLALAPVAASHS